MARLAAYYQEDFHYAPIGYGAKQRKATYVVYDEPKNNLFHDSYGNGGPRIRALASSDPSLSPTYSPKNAIMTLKAKTHPHNNKLVEQSRMAVQRLENLYEPTEVLNPYAVAKFEADMLDCQSTYSHGGRSVYGDPYASHRHKSKDKVCKRLTYDDHWESSQHIPEMCAELEMDRYQTPPNGMQVKSFDTYHREPFPCNGQYIEEHEQCYTPPVSFRSDSSHGRWQQWPWNTIDTRASPAMLSPSPLDSGLSSQSITSSPSLEAEPMIMHKQIQAVRQDVPHVCSCSPMVYAEPGRIISSPGRYDSGRSSPGAYSVASRSKKSRRKSGKHISNGIVYVENDFEDQYSQGQIRYGMLGLVNEPIHPPLALPNIPNGHYHSPEYVQSSNATAKYYYVEENGGPVKVPEKRSSKSTRSQPAQSHPSVIIVEASDKSASSGSPSSPEHEHSDKSPDPELSISPSSSNTASDPPSATSHPYDDTENKERRKSRKKTENEIQELEDMYQKCNLSDYDLLERAERRDLPTAHQLRVNMSPPRLTRSKSDTFYEMLGSTYNNPYEIPRRAPPLRRAGVPDIIEDDMALRKLKKPVTMGATNPTDNTVTYMLCSSHFTPTVPAGRDFMLISNPDVEYDDLSYRKHYHGKKSKIQDPQPPFGIPLRPPPPQCVYNDYLHAVPNGGPPPLCHPRGNPDVVRDDMAFRTLRKDEQEKIYYDITYKKNRG